MSRHQHPPKRHQRAAGQAPSAPLAWLLRDPHSMEELRRTIDAWSRFIERHLQDEEADVRAFAQMAIVRRAAAHAILKEHEASLADVALALHQIPGDALVQCKALEVKAMIQADQEDHAGTLATFAELWPLLSAAALPPEEQAELWLARGKCYGRLKRYEEAISDFTRAHTLDPCCGEALCWRAMARVLGQEEDFRPSEEAMADADQAVVLEPHNATCRRVQGVLLRMAMRFPESLRALRLAERLDPADPWIK
ncbi:MAG TPA: tetratricopeptide repeat protein, partial [Ktedonobacteraceae bacterium]|nr:tetratricopeptide repeat protein [Ktedonobacteraceae bacterium]